MKGITLLLAVSLTSHLFAAGSPDDLLEILKDDLRTEMKEGREKGDNRAYQYQELLMRLQRGASDENEGPLLSVVEALGATSTSEKVSALCTEIATQLRKQMVTQDTALADEMRKVFPEALRRTLDAKTAKDVDEPLVAVAKLTRERNSGRNRDAKLQALLNDGQQLWEFLRQWQDYLAEADFGDARATQQKLQNLVGSGRDFSSFIPRSELLGRMNALRKKAAPHEEDAPPPERSAAEINALIRATMDRCEKLDQMEAAIAVLSVESRNGRNMQQVMGTLNALRQLQRSYEEFQRGQSVRITLTPFSGEDADGRVASLRGQLLLLTLPRVLGLADDQAPTGKENAAAFLQRQLAQAQAAANWTLASRILETAQTLNLQVVASTGDSAALRSFLAGANQEKAKQYLLAVASFQAALKTGSQVIPPELIGSHLETIKKTDPAAFEQGMQLTINPPAEVDPRYPRGYPPGYPYGSPAMMNRTFPGAAAQPERPAESLTVPPKPGVEPKATPALPTEVPAKK